MGGRARARVGIEKGGDEPQDLLVRRSFGGSPLPPSIFPAAGCGCLALSLRWFGMGNDGDGPSFAWLARTVRPHLGRAGRRNRPSHTNKQVRRPLRERPIGRVRRREQDLHRS